MIFRVGLENNNEGNRSIAWALEYPGLFAYGRNGDQALANFPAAVQEYAVWVGTHKLDWIETAHIEIRLEETFEAYFIDKDYDRVETAGDEINAWFRHDWKPLTGAEIERGLRLLTWSRADLMKVIQGLGGEKLDQKYEGERWSINGILRHVGGAEWWYMDRLGRAFPRQGLPADPLERLEKVRARLNEVLPALAESTQVVGVEGEFWSPRKLLRRAVWHERDHFVHIRKLL